EVEVDAICDGEDYLIPGIMEHIERAGIHSGDSISVYPAQRLNEENIATIIEYTGRLAHELNIIGLMNIQYVIHEGEVYVIEVNPRSSRTVPYISKVTNIPMVDLATKIILGSSLKKLGYSRGLYPTGDYVAVKVPVFSFEKLHAVDTHLGPEMKSTGEVLGIAKSFNQALYKGLIAAGYKIKQNGGVLLSVRDQDKEEVADIAVRLEKLGFRLYGTKGTASYYNQKGLHVEAVNKISEGGYTVLDLLESGNIDYVISTSAKGRQPAREGVRIRRKAVERSIACLTAIDTAKVLVDCIEMNLSIQDIDLIDITKI
ncbi:MAG: ATP-grasp domain-containing protein, partial [Peptococcaceae bacterium]|nr:ATP-grasp domain-containing protein [Peptococcaceae bacterium]